MTRARSDGGRARAAQDENAKLLWEYLPHNVAEFAHLSTLTEVNFENGEQVNDLVLTTKLGQGCFGEVGFVLVASSRAWCFIQPWRGTQSCPAPLD